VLTNCRCSLNFQEQNKQQLSKGNLHMLAHNVTSQIKQNHLRFLYNAKMNAESMPSIKSSTDVLFAIYATVTGAILSLVGVAGLVKTD
jgi:hypothetical protein